MRINFDNDGIGRRTLMAGSEWMLGCGGTPIEAENLSKDYLGGKAHSVNSPTAGRPQSFAGN